MGVISTAVKHLIAAGVSGEQLVVAIEEMEAQTPVQTIDEQAERRRAKDRERKARLRKSAESAENIPPLDKEKVRQKETNLPPKEKTPKGVKKKIPHAKKLPDWVDQTEWQAFVEMRKAIKAPLTEGAIKRTIDDLERLKSQGHDPTLCLRQSVQRSYRGVFAPKSDWKDSNKQADGNKNGNKNIAELTPEQLYAEYH